MNIKLSAKHNVIGLGVNRTIVFWLLLDKLQVSGTVWGVFWTINTILILVGFMDLFHNDIAEIQKDGTIKIK